VGDEAGASGDGTNRDGSDDVPEVDADSPGSFAEDASPQAPDGAGGTARTLLGFLRLHTFLDIYKLSGRDKLLWRGKVAYTLEMIFHTLAALLFVSIIAVVAWKTLAPIPHFP